MRKLTLLALAFSFALASTANAQFGDLKDKAKRALRDVKGSDDKKGETALAADETPSRPPARVDKSRQYPPGLSFSSVLNGVALLSKKGQFRLNQIQATFLPSECKEGFTVLRTADGKELCQFDWSPDWLQKPYALLNIRKVTDLSSGANVPGGFGLTQPGDYVLDFYLPDELFYTFSFTVAKVGGDDPFGDGQCYVLGGDWRNWGYLYYRDAQPDQNLQWKVWLRNDACKEKDIKVRIEIVRDSDGAPVCTSRENTTYSVRPEWTRYEFDMVFPEGKEVPHGTYFKAKDLVETDGAYTLTMKIDDQVYGEWKFVIEGGKPKYTGRTLRGEANPLTFIEGGRDAWWYAKQ